MLRFLTPLLRSRATLGLLALALAVTLNPEIRAMLLLTEFLGLEALALMVAAQLLLFRPWLQAMSVRALTMTLALLPGRMRLLSLLITRP